MTKQAGEPVSKVQVVCVHEQIVEHLSSKLSSAIEAPDNSILVVWSQRPPYNSLFRVYAHAAYGSRHYRGQPGRVWYLHLRV